MRELCPQQTRHVSLCEALDQVLNTGVVALGEVTLSVADVDLIYLGLQLVVTSIHGGRELAPSSAGPQPVADSRPRLMPPDENPARPAEAQTSGAALPLPLGGRSEAPACGAPGGKVEPIAGGGGESNREKNGLGRLVLTLMKVLHELLQRQALRRIESGALTPAQVERLGVTLMNQAREIDRLRLAFGLPEQDLNLDLGPLGKLL